MAGFAKKPAGHHPPLFRDDFRKYLVKQTRILRRLTKASKRVAQPTLRHS